MHLQAAKFSVDAKLAQPIHVPLRGTPESLNEVMAGRVDFEFAPLSNAVPLIKAGKLRALAVSTTQRSAFLPDVPTVAEAGVPGFAAQQWFGIFAPKGVPAEIVAKIATATQASLATPEMRQLLVQLSSTPGDEFGPDFGHFVTAEIQADQKIAKAAAITPR
jgi:tripartite-type tricarboxylate transporter receptor subunit TctC